MFITEYHHEVMRHTQGADRRKANEPGAQAQNSRGTHIAPKIRRQRFKLTNCRACHVFRAFQPVVEEVAPATERLRTYSTQSPTVLLLVLVRRRRRRRLLLLLLAYYLAQARRSSKLRSDFWIHPLPRAAQGRPQSASVLAAGTCAICAPGSQMLLAD